jgi:predicted RecB family endonuclease
MMRKIIADQFRKKGFEVCEEVTALEDGGGSLTRSDIVAINKGRDYSLLIDPTIRLETNEN